MSEFQLDSRLQNDTIKVASWPLCEVLMMDDAQYPWLILVPKLNNISELYQLSDEQRLQLDRESVYLAQFLMNIFEGEKMNVAALGNVVRQLHIHHVVRYESDIAWPGPIWGKFPAVSFEDDQLKQRLAILEPLASATFESQEDG